MACAGTYKHRVAVQAATDSTPDDYNQTTKTWVTIGARWALVEPLTGRQLEYGKQLHDQVTYKITMRYFPALGPDNRIIFKDRTFNILSVINPMEANIESVAYCVEEV